MVGDRDVTAALRKDVQAGKYGGDRRRLLEGCRDGSRAEVIEADAVPRRRIDRGRTIDDDVTVNKSIDRTAGRWTVSSRDAARLTAAGKHVESRINRSGGGDRDLPRDRQR